PPRRSSELNSAPFRAGGTLLGAATSGYSPIRRWRSPQMGGTPPSVSTAVTAVAMPPIIPQPLPDGTNLTATIVSRSRLTTARPSVFSFAGSAMPNYIFACQDEHFRDLNNVIDLQKIISDALSSPY